MCDERKRKDDRAGREIDRKQDEGGRAVRERDTGEIKRHWNEVERGKELVGTKGGEAYRTREPTTERKECRDKAEGGGEG